MTLIVDNYPAHSSVKGLNSILPQTRSVIHSLVNTTHGLQPSERFLTHTLITYLAILARMMKSLFQNVPYLQSLVDELNQLHFKGITNNVKGSKRITVLCWLQLLDTRDINAAKIILDHVLFSILKTMKILF